MAKARALDVLDDPAVVERLDAQGALTRIEALPEQCGEAWQRAKQLDLPAEYVAAKQVVVLGMGGSAIAGDILRSLTASTGRKPVVVSRGYDVPAFVDRDTLVIACSHSGNTEETLSAFEQALDAGARGLAIATGGQLAVLARERGAQLAVYEYAGEPRSALGHQLMTLLAVGERTGLLPAQDEAMEEATALMRAQREAIGSSARAATNAAKQLAGRLRGRIPAVVGAGVLAEAAHRWKTQLNENAKCWAIWEELPELDHNAVVGFGLPAEALPRLHVISLWHAALHPRVLLRYGATEAEFARAGVSFERLEVAGEAPLAQVLGAIYFGDLMSYYLGLLYGVEPSGVAPIDRVKAALAEH